MCYVTEMVLLVSSEKDHVRDVVPFGECLLSHEKRSLVIQNFIKGPTNGQST